MPPDIHPLPDSVAAYFAYPFTLEPKVLTLEAARQSTLMADAARREAFLRAREEEKERRRRAEEEEKERKRREALRKVAPGFEPAAGTLVPKRLSVPPGNTSTNMNTTLSANANPNASNRAMMVPSLFPPPPPPQPRDVMADLVDQLAALDAASSSSSHS